MSDNNKKSTKKCGFLPEKQAEANPCKKLYGAYRMTNLTNNQQLTIWCLTMIDPATGWVDI